MQTSHISVLLVAQSVARRGASPTRRTEAPVGTDLVTAVTEDTTRSLRAAVGAVDVFLVDLFAALRAGLTFLNVVLLLTIQVRVDVARTSASFGDVYGHVDAVARALLVLGPLTHRLVYDFLDHIAQDGVERRTCITRLFTSAVAALSFEVGSESLTHYLGTGLVYLVDAFEQVVADPKSYFAVPHALSSFSTVHDGSEGETSRSSSDFSCACSSSSSAVISPTEVSKARVYPS